MLVVFVPGVYVLPYVKSPAEAMNLMSDSVAVAYICDGFGVTGVCIELEEQRRIFFSGSRFHILLSATVVGESFEANASVTTTKSAC